MTAKNQLQNTVYWVRHSADFYTIGRKFFYEINFFSSVNSLMI